MVIALILSISGVREKLSDIDGLLHMRSSLNANGSVSKDLHNAVRPMRLGACAAALLCIEPPSS